MKKYLYKFYTHHFEWFFLVVGLSAMAMMNPYIDNGSSICLFNYLGLSFCPGEGLGHSIAYLFRTDFANAFKAHPIGPFAVFIISGRIIFLWKQAFGESWVKQS